MSRTSMSATLYDSILNHVFLPCHLPKSSVDDCLMSNDQQNGYQLLRAMSAFLKSLEDSYHLPGFSVLRRCVSRWTSCQDPNNVSAIVLQEAIDELTEGDYFPMYFATHNAALLITSDPHEQHRSLISAWQVQLSSKNMTTSLMPYFSSFPSPTFELPDQSELRSTAHCELLLDLLHNSFEYCQAHRSSRSFDETREITMSHYVTEWWINHFQKISPMSCGTRSVSFRKKQRDQIRWKNAELPFRRSGFWTTMKTIIQAILAEHCGQSAKLVYKLLITSFLTDFLRKRQYKSDCSILNVDLLMFCLKKITRRLNKIHLLWNTIEREEIAHWAQHIHDDIDLKLRAMVPYSTWQIPIGRKNDGRQQSLIKFSKLADISFYAHSCQKLVAYLNEPNFSLASHSGTARVHHNALAFDQSDVKLPLPRILTSATTETIGVVLIIVEHWFEKHLDQWMEHFSLVTDGVQRFKDLLELFEAYQRKALEHYYAADSGSDSFGYTRFLLASLTILRSMHRKLCAEPRLQRLVSHSIVIPNLFELVDFLSLPTRKEMLRAHELIDYFRAFSGKTYPDILSDIESSNAFGVQFASHSTEMRNTLRQIRDEAERDRQAKTIEVRNAKERYDAIMERANALSCACAYEEVCNRRWGRSSRRLKKCQRCRLIDSARQITVAIYECPIPSNEDSALAVVFELQMPMEFRYYREVLWQFINRPQPHPSVSGYKWLQVRPHREKLSKFYTGGGNHHVNLISSRESLSQTHYSRPLAVGSHSLDSYLHENHLFVQITSTRAAQLSDECRILTPQLHHPDYKSLQFTLSSTECEQNSVISQSIQCPSGLKVSEFIEFGSFRSGHRLQWWNLLSALELDSLSLDEESVVLLLTHSLMQNGPMTDEAIDSWCPQAHRVLFDDQFVDELLIRLDRRLEDHRSNWQNVLSFLVIVIVTMRVVTLCRSTRTARLIDLVCKCRAIGEESIEKITQIIHKINSMQLKERAKLREKIVLIGTGCLFTFALHPRHQPLSNQAIISLLHASTSIHDHLLLSEQRSSTPSSFMRNLLRWRDRILLQLQPTIAEFLHSTAYQGLHQFTEQHWPVIGANQWTAGTWQKQSGIGEYTGQYGSVTISIDCLCG